MVRPRARRIVRDWRGSLLLLLAVTVAFGCGLAVSGNAPAAAILAAALLAVVAIASNAKRAVLGEPLLFSDLALVGALVRHPGFYLTALSLPQRALGVAGALALPVALAWLFVPRPAPHLAGAAIGAAALVALLALLRLPPLAVLARVPDAEADLARHGLVATLLLYWRRWRVQLDPPALPPDQGAPGPELVIVVQCESFADPVALAGAAPLPALARARAAAWQWGELHVSGFGAYTMRTEYGVLFGRDEAALGFRRYDPFLTAAGEASYALSARLRGRGYRTLFVHPHDLRFYGRDRLMPAVGFERLVGDDAFVATAPGIGRYVDDRALGMALGALADAAGCPTFVYAVTMENHGPWGKERIAGSPGGLDAYLRHLRGSDAMLGDLIDHLDRADRRAVLVFFGDHRPSIPGASEPGPDRHTPYVILRFGDRPGSAATGAEGGGEAGRRVDLTPAGLHHAILAAVATP
ncbi:LTA synthase family protein [Sphingomonas sp. RHCKR7]|nr:LTA synthase family protein [Sphingomonas folli]